METIDLKEIGRRLRLQRTQLGYTREALSEKLGVTPKFCSDLEMGQKGMSVQTLCRIAAVLRLPTDYILFGTSQGGDCSAILAMLKRCPPEKIKYAEEMLRNFLLALE